MSFGFFIVAALDLLGVLETAIPAEERQSWVEWIYACQVPHTGGFRGFTGTNLGGVRSMHNWHWDPANLPNTYFALATLVILGDDLGRVKRRECLAWVRRLQKEDGSFGEFLGEDEFVHGGRDPRLCMCAVGTLKILQDQRDEGGIGIDQDALQRFLASCQSHEGGIGQGPLLEAHSGLNYCGIASLSFISLLHQGRISVQKLAEDIDLDTQGCVRWMLDRQTTFIDEDDSEDGDSDHGADTAAIPHEPDSQSLLGSEKSIAGFCGRSGKVADTCYCFWNVGALAVSVSIVASKPLADSFRYSRNIISLESTH
jgi:geranylgeranyl transferase type-1 subunit beta